MKKLFVICFFTLLSIGCVDGNFKPISSELLSNDSSSEEYLISELKRLKKWKVKKEFLDDSTNAFMFTNNLVIDLVKNPDSHFKLLQKQITKSKIEVDVKVLWIQLSQCVSDSNYFELIEDVLQSGIAYDEKLILIKTLLFPGFEWGTRFSDNYSQPRYQNVFKVIGDQARLSKDLKEFLDLIFDGTNADYLRVHRGIEGEYPRISCNK